MKDQDTDSVLRDGGSKIRGDDGFSHTALAGSDSKNSGHIVSS